ncbi:MAG: hydroxyacid dehydrogenase [Candidatus Thorarchaeota archaeon]|nr:hydroxyacid dehydrogenase [Candidatus Thorarchaeota archaeon]
MTRVLIADPIAPAAQKKIEDAGLEVVVRSADKDGPITQQIKGFDCIVVRSATKVTKEVIDAADKLKLIVRAGVGLDNVDAEAAKAKGIKVMNTPEAPSISVAELVFAMFLGLARSLTQADSSMKSERWEKKKLTGMELWNKTVGIVGLGRIGTEVARRAKAFGMNVLVLAHRTDVTMKCSELGLKKSTLEEILTESDFITVHVPLLPETKGMIGAKELAKMKKTAFVVNTSRGGVIDEAALLKALDEGQIAGAGLDVFESEPPVDWKLVKHPKVIATPHVASSTQEAQEKVGDLAAEKVVGELGKK